MNAATMYENKFQPIIDQILAEVDLELNYPLYKRYLMSLNEGKTVKITVEVDQDSLSSINTVIPTGDTTELQTENVSKTERILLEE